MRKFFTGLVLIPLAVIFIVFAVANRHLVKVSFDPFNSSDPSVALTMPLFAVIIAAVIVGVLAGGIMTWFKQRHWRRSARLNETEARQARAELADLRSRAAASTRSIAAPPSQVSGYGATARDKRDATL
jgi:uncharacterized integral membrane protein